MAGNWEGSRRTETLPENWPELRQQILARDGRRCQAILESTGQKCGAPGNQVDHINRFGSQTDPNNLQVLCSWHHSKKSSTEGNQSQSPRPTMSRPKPKHPGLK